MLGAMTAERGRIIESLRRAFAEDATTRLAVLFGSAARDRLTAQSDADIGVIPVDPAASLAWELELQGRLTRACGRVVDVVRLDTASTLVRWEAARDAVVLRAVPEGELPRFLANAALEHADIAPLLERTAETFRKRVAAGGAPAVASEEGRTR